MAPKHPLRAQTSLVHIYVEHVFAEFLLSFLQKHIDTREEREREKNTKRIVKKKNNRNTNVSRVSREEIRVVYSELVSETRESR